MFKRFARRYWVLTAMLVIAICFAGGWLAVNTRLYQFTNPSFEERFAESKRELEEYAALAMTTDPSKPLPAMPRWLGSFEPGKVERLPHGFLFFCDYGHPLDANGIAYSTEPLPEKVGERDFFTHIEGNWYKIWRN